MVFLNTVVVPHIKGLRHKLLRIADLPENDRYATVTVLGELRDLLQKVYTQADSTLPTRLEALFE